MFGGVCYRFAEAADEACIKKLLRDNSMSSWVAISTEHEPSYFASSALFGRRRTMIARDACDDAPIGMASYVVMPVYCNGRTVSGGYLGELRVFPEFRNRLRVIRNGYNAIAALSDSIGGAPRWFTSIAKENSSAKRLLEANLKGMPAYTPVGEMQTRALSVNKGKHQNVMRQATSTDIARVAKFYSQSASQYQFAPAITESWLRSLDGRHGLRLEDFWLLEENGRLRASFAIWDQQLLKQTVVRGYRFPLSKLRVVYNGYAGVTGRVVLPKVGGHIQYAFIAFLATEDNGSDISLSVINSALALVKARQLPIAMLGTASGNPVARVLERIPSELYETTIYSVAWPEAVETPPPLDGRLVQPEIAIL